MEAGLAYPLWMPGSYHHCHLKTELSPQSYTVDVKPKGAYIPWGLEHSLKGKHHAKSFPHINIIESEFRSMTRELKNQNRRLTFTCCFLNTYHVPNTSHISFSVNLYNNSKYIKER